MTSQLSVHNTIELEVRCPLSGPALHILRMFVETVARQMGFDGESIAQIEMAVDEACSNVWLHAYPDEKSRPGCPSGEVPFDVILRVRLERDGICIRIIDQGIGDQEGPHSGIRTLEEYCERTGGYHGLGTFIIRSFMDEVEYHYPAEKGTILQMKKYLKGAQRGQ